MLGSVLKAPIKSRIMAFIIDFSIILVASTLPLVFINLVHFQWIIGIILIFSITLTSFRDVYKGASIGKKILGICILDSRTKSYAKTKAILIRGLFTCIWPIELIYMISSGKRFGDIFCQTEVYQIKQAKKYKVITTLISIFVVFIISFYFMGIILIASSEPYKVAKDYILSNQEIKLEIGNVTGFNLFTSTEGFKIEDGKGSAYFEISTATEKGKFQICIQLLKDKNNGWMVQNWNL